MAEIVTLERQVAWLEQQRAELLYELKASQDALCYAWCNRKLNDHTMHCKGALAAIAKAEGR
jgi:hypothetical protein